MKHTNCWSYISLVPGSRESPLGFELLGSAHSVHNESICSAWYVHEHIREHMRHVRTLDSMTGTEVPVTLLDAEVVS